MTGTTTEEEDAAQASPATTQRTYPDATHCQVIFLLPFVKPPGESASLVSAHIRLASIEERNGEFVRAMKYSKTVHMQSQDDLKTLLDIIAPGLQRLTVGWVANAGNQGEISSNQLSFGRSIFRILPFFNKCEMQLLQGRTEASSAVGASWSAEKPVERDVWERVAATVRNKFGGTLRFKFSPKDLWAADADVWCSFWVDDGTPSREDRAAAAMEEDDR